MKHSVQERHKGIASGMMYFLVISFCLVLLSKFILIPFFQTNSISIVYLIIVLALFGLIFIWYLVGFFMWGYWPEKNIKALGKRFRPKITQRLRSEKNYNRKGVQAEIKGLESHLQKLWPFQFKKRVFPSFIYELKNILRESKTHKFR